MRRGNISRRAFVAALPAALAALSSCASGEPRSGKGSDTPAQALRQSPGLPDGPPAPDFTGGGAWLNTAPLTLEELRGRVVLVDFWTYGCYNCQNTLPAMRGWWATYKDRGLVIVGVHTPEFEHERDLENVRAAVQRAQITWPVVQDNEMRIWRAYGNHYWPHFYLVDHRGQIVYDRIGEGAYDITERWIADALAARPTA